MRFPVFKTSLMHHFASALLFMLSMLNMQSEAIAKTAPTIALTAGDMNSYRCEGPKKTKIEFITHYYSSEKDEFDFIRLILPKQKVVFLFRAFSASGSRFLSIEDMSGQRYEFWSASAGTSLTVSDAQNVVKASYDNCKETKM